MLATGRVVLSLNNARLKLAAVTVVSDRCRSHVVTGLMASDLFITMSLVQDK